MMRRPKTRDKYESENPANKMPTDEISLQEKHARLEDWNRQFPPTTTVSDESLPLIGLDVAYVRHRA